MRIYYVTPEMPLAGEGELLSSMIEEGVECVHLRHPLCSCGDIERILKEIPHNLRNKVSLHDFHHLAIDYGCGVHLNGRHPYAPDGYRGRVSRSCHSLEEIINSNVDYCFISPVFDSISKSGYKAGKFDMDLLKELLCKNNIVALGGISPDKFAALKSLGFSSVALSGYLTGEGNPTEIIKRLQICFNS